MKHENEDDVICPYCDHRHCDSWEFSDNEEQTCQSCDATFLLTKNVSVSYSTRRVPCDDDQHDYAGEIERIDFGQETIDRWISEGGVMATIAKRDGTHTMYVRACNVCGNKDRVKVPLNAPPPPTHRGG